MKSFCPVLLFCLLAADQILAHSIQPRLIAPDVADADDKAQNTVAFVDSESVILGTGSFIHSSWIVTSAWCTKKINLNTRYLLSGKIADKYEKALALYDIKPHEQYNPLSMINDIGLVKVAVPVSLKVNLFPKVNKDLTDLYFQARGLGLNDFDGTAATQLRQAKVQIRDNKSYCSKYGLMPINTVCSRHSLACLGDSGGPLVDGEYIWGVISVSEDNAEMCSKSIAQPNPRTVYTLILPQRAWIQKTTGIAF